MDLGIYNNIKTEIINGDIKNYELIVELMKEMENELKKRMDKIEETQQQISENHDHDLSRLIISRIELDKALDKIEDLQKKMDKMEETHQNRLANLADFIKQIETRINELNNFENILTKKLTTPPTLKIVHRNDFGCENLLTVEVDSFYKSDNKTTVEIEINLIKSIKTKLLSHLGGGILEIIDIFDKPCCTIICFDLDFMQNLYNSIVKLAEDRKK